MSTWYRAHQANSQDMVFSGEGGLFVAGRWHAKGQKVVYCSASIALCTLEWLSHHGLSVSGFSYVKYAIEVDDDLIRYCNLNALPKHWDKSPSTDVTRAFAQEYLFEQTQYAALALPSVVVPEEYNLVINPLHPAYPSIRTMVKKLGVFKAPER